ncbi:2-amino-4-hydroxy-6-hydroxymethyldihydropteridine diphosphokinase [Candidatus Ichthyocystis sparus]|uniref:2-amino-4-hydroxy-6- hydroxymethyldihydropteridine diphosphokinase n=1 Tax=Candidatus Ichthyocystis sparus TaxID=1561004 RepID=UPI000AFDCFB1|nr:2-amino-4-hydroxy-6-hydroxymethyldihydropteridine diphosphokinase [Candidatus Ichthyocystis sparus]
MDAYLSVGSNQGQRECYLSYAANLLECDHRISIIKKSSIYDSVPCINVWQPNFLNAVFLIKTTYSLSDLGRAVLMIENLLGRRRQHNIRYGPRTLDIDVIIYGYMPYSEGSFTVPHCKISERAFVLVPLLEIAGNIHITGHGYVKDMLHSLSQQHLVKTDLQWSNELIPSFCP